MHVVPIKSFPHDRRGQMVAGRVYEVDDAEGKRLVSLRLVRPASPDEYAVKAEAHKPVAGPIPSQAVGEVQPSSASQAAQALPQTIASPLESGDLEPAPQVKRRGRPPKSA